MMYKSHSHYLLMASSSYFNCQSSTLSTTGKTSLEEAQMLETNQKDETQVQLAARMDCPP